MPSFYSVPEAHAAIDRYLIQHAQGLDQMAQEALFRATFARPALEKIATTAETIYALGAAADPEAKALAIGLIKFCAQHGFFGFGADARTLGMVAALRRDLGEDAPLGGWPDAANDPAPHADLVMTLGMTITSSDPAQA